MNNTQLFEIIDEWNFWNKPIPEDLVGFRRRHYLNKLLPLMDTREIIILGGARRSGKSTLVYQMLDSLIKDQVDPSSFLYVNFEDYRFVDTLDVKLIERIGDLYFEKVNPKKKFCYFFLDEVQNIPNFEKYLRTAYDQKRPIKFIISGSNSKILAGEIADVLTGRNITTTVYPFSLLEYLEFKQPAFSMATSGNLEDLYIKLNDQKALIKNTLDTYLNQGGYPEITQLFAKNGAYQAGKIITQYFDDIIFKDIVKRHNLRNAQAVFNIARFCIENTANLLSYTKIAKILQINTRQLIEYLDYFEKAFFIFQNRFFSWKIKETLAANKPKKLYVIDHFYKVHMGLQKDFSRVVENIVYLELKSNFPDVFYWKEKGEVDFVARTKAGLCAIQVSYANELPQRETASLIEFSQKFGSSRLYVITEDRFETEQHGTLSIQHIPLWLFLVADKGMI